MLGLILGTSDRGKEARLMKWAGRTVEGSLNREAGKLSGVDKDGHYGMVGYVGEDSRSSPASCTLGVLKGAASPRPEVRLRLARWAGAGLTDGRAPWREFCAHVPRHDEGSRNETCTMA